jgi:hypothetical protein
MREIILDQYFHYSSRTTTCALSRWLHGSESRWGCRGQACLTWSMKRIVLAVAVLLISSIVPLETATASSTSPSCPPSVIHISQSGVLAGAGSVNLLFSITSDSRQDCSLKGYPRFHFYAESGARLSVGETDRATPDGNWLGGLAKGISLPKVTLSKGKHVASFFMDGNEMATSAHCISTKNAVGMLPRSQTPIHISLTEGSSYNWCAGIMIHPIVPGITGKDPPGPI